METQEGSSVSAGQWTPGPWGLRGPTQVYGNFQHDQNSTADLVATVVRKEDAPVVAAAPELLDALKATLAAINASYQLATAEAQGHERTADRLDKEIQAARAKARAAIREATGGADDR